MHPTKTVFNDLVGPKDRQNLSLSNWLALLRGSIDGLPPDVPNISVAAPRPLGSTWVLHIEPGIERHAMRGRVGAVDGGLARLSHGGGLCLAGQEERVGVGIGAREDLVGEEHDQGGRNGGTPAVPLIDKARDALVDLPHDVLEEAVEHNGRITGPAPCVA